MFYIVNTYPLITKNLKNLTIEYASVTILSKSSKNF